MTLPAINLNRQVAVVTGGGRGLGQAMAQRLAGCFISVRDNVPDLIQNTDTIQRDDLYKLRLQN